MNIVIMAGGGGTRLWPLSRDSYPKQFTQLFGKKTLLQHTFVRALKIAGKPENIVITTRTAFVSEIRKQLKRLPASNILVEQVKRDTAPSIGMAATFFASKGKYDEAMILMPSDPYFRNEKLFIKTVKAAGNFIEKNPSFTAMLGSVPTYPETGYGYIETGTDNKIFQNVELSSVKSFREKPNIAMAQQFITQGNFVWNMGVYVWRVGTLLELLHKFAPEIAQKLDKIEELFRAKKTGLIGKVYESMPKISIDFAVTEHQNPADIFVARGDFGWSDIGHWGALQELMGGKEGLEMKKGIAAQINSSNNFVYNTAEKAIGLVGVKDLIVISTPDALLVCNKNDVQDVKKIVEMLGADKKGKKFI